MKKRRYYNKYKSIDHEERVEPSAVAMAIMLMVAMGIGALAYHLLLTFTGQI